MKVTTSSLHDMLAGLLTMWILAAILVLPAHASLQILGEPRHAGLWQRIYDRLPTVWKSEHPVLVQEVSYQDLNPDQDAESRNSEAQTADEESFVDGEYEEADAEAGTLPRIRLLNTLDEEATSLVFAHEYGHFVWCECLTATQQQRYIQLWQKQKQAGKLITDYAAEDAMEGFAEAFAYFVQSPDELRDSDEKSWRFLLALQNQGQRKNKK